MSSAEWILLLAALVLVPLGRALIRPRDAGPLEQMLWRAADWCQWPASGLLIVALYLPQGRLAALLAVPWFAITLLCAGCGALRIWQRPWALDAARLQDVGLIYLLIGGAWTVISCGGWRPQDFSDQIVLLTGVHFHYAGFALPLLASRVAERFPGWRATGLILGVGLGVPLVGVGISLSPTIEVVAALALVLTCLGVAVGQVVLALRSKNSSQVNLLLISSLSLFTAMLLAATYALGEFTHNAWLSIDTMILTHGWANSVGFAGCGLLAWRSADHK